MINSFRFGVGTIAFQLSTTGNFNSTTACSLNTTSEKYRNGLPSAPVIGNIVYTDATGATTFDGLSIYWHSTTDDKALRIDANGEIIAIFTCVG